MKKAFLTCFTGMLLTWTMTSVSYSQNLNSSAKPGSSDETFILSSEKIDVAKNPVPPVPGEISAKALKKFSRDYENVTNAEWFKSGKGFAVYFTTDGVKTRAFYNKKGHWEGMVRDYFEDKLPRDVRHLVKSTYYDFNITFVNEVTYDGITAYVVHMEDKTHWKTIKVIDGEMEVTQEYTKR